MAKSIILGESVRTQDRIKLTFDPAKGENSKVSGKLLPDDIVDVKLPRELSEINRDIDFVNYCKLAYSRINQGETLIYHDKPEGSITPRSEGYTDIIKEGLIEDFRVENLKIIEHESHQVKAIGSKPTVFLEKYFENTNKTIVSLHNGIIFLKDYQLHIRAKDLSSTAVVDDTKPLVRRFGMNPNSLTTLTNTPLKGNELHFIEKELFTRALTELNAKKSGEAIINEHNDNYPNNVVLIDIFVREADKIRKDANSDNPETHTIALWKKKHNILLLIDPSKVDYSKDLKKALENQAGNGLEVQIHSPTKGVLYGTGGKETGYSNILANSIEKHKYRDCIDVAVKIGFELNELQINGLNCAKVQKAQ